MDLTFDDLAKALLTATPEQRVALVAAISPETRRQLLIEELSALQSEIIGRLDAIRAQVTQATPVEVFALKVPSVDPVMAALA